MLSINDLKIGTKIIFNHAPFQVILAQHSKLGRGGGILRTKIKNLINGAILEKTFAGQEKIEEAHLETRVSQFLYHDENEYFFMDSTSFEQFSLQKSQLGKTADFLKEGENVQMLYFESKPINLQLPIKINLKITYTEPGFKGNTAGSVTKSATLETGAQMKVPLFIKEGDEIVVDTRTGEYVERA